MAAYLPAEGQSQVWAEGADTLISASFRPSGAASIVDGGWVLSGTWHYLSGIAHADWALICFSPKGEGARYAAVPASQLNVLDDWSTLGMRGTGSHSIQLSNVFVPESRTFLKQDLWAGKARAAAGPSYQVSPVDVDPPLFAGVALGAARGAIDLWTSRWRDFRPDGETGIAYARSLAELDAANLLLERACRASDTGLLSMIDTGRNGRDASLAIEYILTAIGRIFRLSGSQAHFDQSAALRHWRDVQTLSSHVALRQDLNFSQYTKGVWQSQESVDPRAA
jgi:alkylation response protein AidB-like acyl-CoA dehydrogenase